MFIDFLTEIPITGYLERIIKKSHLAETIPAQG